MKRLGIFSYYDKNGIVDSYIEYLLDSLIDVIDDLIIVVNGKLTFEGKKIFLKYTKYIIVRENKGFDAGAYCCAIVSFLGKEQLCIWDEVVLCNNTFYGPFFSFKYIFEYMSLKSGDFWGLNFVENNITNHIQSYFLVFRKKIVQSGDLYSFFFNIRKKLSCLSDVYAFFEVGIFYHLIDRGYQFNIFTNTENYDIYKNANICIKNYRLPILKKKTFQSNFFNLEQQKYILNYLIQTTKYDINHILLNAKREYSFDTNLINNVNKKNSEGEKIINKIPISSVTSYELINFIKSYEEIYIYGTGIVARKIWVVYYKYMKHFKGFFISKSQKMLFKSLYGFPVKYYNCTSSQSTNAIIIGLNPENSINIKKNLSPKDITLFLW